MIIERTPLSMVEVEELLEKVAESDKKKATKNYLKRFLKTKPETAKKIKEELEKLDLLKLKPHHIVKIIDLLPEDHSDLNKIFTDVSLTKDEAEKILEVVKRSQ